MATPSTSPCLDVRSADSQNLVLRSQETSHLPEVAAIPGAKAHSGSGSLMCANEICIFKVIPIKKLKESNHLPRGSSYCKSIFY